MPEKLNPDYLLKTRDFRINPNALRNVMDGLISMSMVDPTEVKGVWFNPPHTTVRWGNDETTTVTCGEEDTYDPMLGFLLCVAKRYFGNTGRYLEVMRANGVPECPKPTTIEIKVGKADYVCVSTEAWNEVVDG